MNATYRCFLGFCVLVFVAGTHADSANEVSRQLLARIESMLANDRFVPNVLLSDIRRLQNRKQSSTELDHYQQWIEWVEKYPRKLGRSRFVNEPLVAGAVVNIRQVYRIGTDITDGGGILVAKHWQHPVEFQTVDASASNFIRLSTNRSGLELAETTIAHRGIYGGLDNELALPFFEVIRGQLKAEDEITVEYLNLSLPTNASDTFSLPLYFRTDVGSGLFLATVAYLQINAGAVKKVDVIVPSRINPGQGFVPKIIATDQYGNLARGRIPSLEVLVDGIFHHRIPAGTQNYHEFQELAFESRGHHLIEVKSSGGGISGKSNPFLVEYSEQEILWGETHEHSNLGEGRGAEASTNGLDFVIPAIHHRYFIPSKWDGLDDPKAWVWSGELQTGGYQLAITRDPPSQVRTQHELVRESISGQRLMIALAEVPADDRFLDNKVTRLVEMVAGESHFEWYANQLLQRGYRLGFTASAHNHLLPIGDTGRNALTAVITYGHEGFLDALYAGRTFITSGDRILLDVKINGADPGSRIEQSARRIIRGQVMGTAPVHKVELIKNGQVIDSINYAGDVSSQTLRISFYSSSEPALGQRDLPRNGREWIGFFIAPNSTLTKVIAPGFRNSTRQAILLNPGVQNRLDFITWTRGTSSSFMVDIETLDDDAVFELNLRGGHEDFDVSPLTRPPSPIPPNRQMVSLYDLKQHPVVRNVAVDVYADEITFELVNKDTSSYVEFEFLDLSSPREGDYYYVRVRQLNDQMAWSSPVFVGGYDQP